MNSVSAWKTWVASGVTIRRKLIVQVISANRLTYSWQSYQKAIENFASYSTPEESVESLAEAAKLCTLHGWSPAKLRAWFR